MALPSIGKALDFSQENLPWVVNAYVLTFGGFLLLGGRTADLLGRRRVFMAGLLLVAVASLAAGFAATEGQLIAARAAQGLGAAIISPAALSIVTTTFSDGAERNKALGVWGAVAGSGGAAGVLLGGILTDGLGWEWVLWVNVPVSLIALRADAAADRRKPRRVRDPRLRRRRRGHRHRGALDPRLRAGRRQRRRLGLEPDARPDRALGGCCWPPSSRSSCARAKPLVPFSIFRIRTLTGANVVGLLVGASLFSMFFFISLYMQQVLGYSAIHAGLSYLPLALVIMASAGIASQLVTKLGYKPVLAAGLLFIVIGLLWFSRVSVGGGFTTDILGPSLFAAAGLGFAFVTTTIAAVSGVEENEAGLASGLINTSQQIGGALGLAVLSAVATSRTDDVMSTGGSTLANGLTEGFQAAFLGGAAIAAARLRPDPGPDPRQRQPRPRRARQARATSAKPHNRPLQ